MACASILSHEEKYFYSDMNIAKNLTRDDNKFRQTHDLHKYLLYI